MHLIAPFNTIPALAGTLSLITVVLAMAREANKGGLSKLNPMLTLPVTMLYGFASFLAIDTAWFHPWWWFASVPLLLTNAAFMFGGAMLTTRGLEYSDNRIVITKGTLFHRFLQFLPFDLEQSSLCAISWVGSLALVILPILFCAGGSLFVAACVAFGVIAWIIFGRNPIVFAWELGTKKGMPRIYWAGFHIPLWWKKRYSTYNPYKNCHERERAYLMFPTSLLFWSAISAAIYGVAYQIGRHGKLGAFMNFLHAVGHWAWFTLIWIGYCTAILLAFYAFWWILEKISARAFKYTFEPKEDRAGDKVIKKNPAIMLERETADKVAHMKEKGFAPIALAMAFWALFKHSYCPRIEVK